MKLNEESVFTEALAKTDPQERAAFLDQVCVGEPALRDSVESLLAAYEAGSFLETPAVERPGDELKDQAPGSSTQAEPTMDMNDRVPLEFLTPSDKPDVLGRLGHYDVQEVVGHGGMGIVLRAFDEKLHRIVAIKVMAAQLATNATARKRFSREAQAAAAVSHDHIVTIHAVEEANGLPYLVMHYVSGMSLQERLDKSGPLQLHEILRVGMQTASGLAAAHAQGLIHRDIKPANILLENGVERVKVTDFGLARAGADASLTQSGMIAGTPQYMSPEQAEGKALDQRSDLFSLGSVLYAMCTGRAPFRASGSMAVLKRVCEATPTPIRQTNPEIPDWLVAIIAKLQAKDPVERFQSATEVAELLSQHLAHVQHPSVVGQAAVGQPFQADGPGQARKPDLRKPAPRRRRLVMAAAAVLLCFAAGLSLTEATGVANFRGTVIRVFTPDGTLVVEVDDPGVKVTIEGDGGLVITGAGPQEVRLRPGSYKVRATKDGKPVRQEELVTINGGGKQVVRVSLEDAPVAAKAAVKGETGAFVLLAAGKERKFDTLAEAVQGASDGDTIEVRGNGPFITKPINFGKTALTIRAGAGFRPVIKADPTDHQAFGLFVSNAPLILEGLEVHRMVQNPLAKDANAWRVIVYSYAPFYAANCRFVARQIQNGISAASPVCELRNCEILCPEGDGVVWAAPQSGSRLVIANCLQAGGQIVVGNEAPDAKEPGSIQLTRNTSLTTVPLRFMFAFEKWQRALKGDKQSKLLRLEASGNVFDASSVLSDVYFDKDVPGGEAEAFLTERVGWQGQQNLFAASDLFLRLLAPPKVLQPTRPIKSLADWKQFWGSAEAGSIEGRVRCEGGDLRSQLAVAPEKLTPDDFRLRADSPGYKAGKDGKDLGADVDLVGPGPAYERWKKTPEYQQWLKDTKHVKKAEAPKAEPQAFVLLGGKDVLARKFDTLAEAVQGASDGDTIEVRGNGPFVSEPIEIKQALTIRAGTGFRPVITDTPQPPMPDGATLLVASAPLRLEGLDLRCTKRLGIVSAQAPLSAAHCRFLTSNDLATCIGFFSTAGLVRNCELSSPSGAALFFRGDSDASFVVENCLLVGHNNLHDADVTQGAMVRLTRNTFVTAHAATAFYYWIPRTQVAKPPSKRIRVFTSENVFASEMFVFQWLHPKESKPPLTLAEAEIWLPRRFEWREEWNLYRAGKPLLSIAIDGGPVPATRSGENLADWTRFWGRADTRSSEGIIRFQGGDLNARAKGNAEKLTPDDFRLRPDSAGYRAGKDKKDLGADVDLVGPGPAYERWKKTPEYQQWLKDTGQRK